jgi:hypothetical protein
MTANVNVTKLLFKRGNTAQNAAYTGINGEITVDTQAKTLRVHDGVTTGGNIVTAGAMASYIPTDPTITSIQANVAAANAAISAITGIDTSLLANAATQQTQINLLNANVTAANALIPNLIAISSNIIPAANVTYSLGSEQFQWRDLWVSNNTIYIGNTPIRVDGSTLLVNGAPVSGGSTYGNANVAAYLPTYTGNIAANIVSPTVPTIGGTASAGEAGITYLSGDLSKWAIFTEGAFTVGVWTDVQPGWTVTDNNGFTDIIAGRGSFGAASFQNTVNNWPSPASGKTYVFTSPDYQLGYTNPVEITVGSNDWRFGTNGTTTFPGGTNIIESSSNNLGIYSNNPTRTNGLEIGTNSETNLFNQNKVQIISNVGSGSNKAWEFGADGTLTFPTGGNLIFDSSAASVIDGVTSIVANGNISASQYNFANGVNILSTVGAGAYGNTQVASYLLNFDGDIEFTSSTARIGNVDVITVMDSIRSPAYQFSNGVSIFDGITGTYSNTNVEAYLTTGVTTANLTTTGNVVQQSAYYETYANVTNSGGNLTCNFVNGATFYATLTANVTVNFTNVVATAGQVTGATLIVDQGATAYGVANIQINSGGVQTIKYAGGTPNTGTASNTDIMSFSLISLDGTNWRVLGQIANYG